MFLAANTIPFIILPLTLIISYVIAYVLVKKYTKKMKWKVIIFLVAIFVYSPVTITTFYENPLFDTMEEDVITDETNVSTNEAEVPLINYEELITELGFVNFNGNFILEIPVNNLTISLNNFYGVQTIVAEFESNVDGSLFSYYPLNEVGYIDCPDYSDTIEYNYQTEFVTDNEFVLADDLLILEVLKDKYFEILEALDITHSTLLDYASHLE